MIFLWYIARTEEGHSYGWDQLRMRITIAKAIAILILWGTVRRAFAPIERSALGKKLQLSMGTTILGRTTRIVFVGRANRKRMVRLRTLNQQLSNRHHSSNALIVRQSFDTNLGWHAICHSTLTWASVCVWCVVQGFPGNFLLKGIPKSTAAAHRGKKCNVVYVRRCLRERKMPYDTRIWYTLNCRFTSVQSVNRHLAVRKAWFTTTTPNTAVWNRMHVHIASHPSLLRICWVITKSANIRWWITVKKLRE